MAIFVTLIAHAPTAATRMAAFPADEAVLIGAKAIAASLSLPASLGQPLSAAPEARTRETAKALSGSVVIDPALRDCDYGRWAGKSLTSLQLDEPAALAEWRHEFHAKPHGGESFADVQNRIIGWLDALTAFRGQVCAVTHPPVMRAALVYVLGAPPAAFWRIEIGTLGMVRLSHDGKSWKLQELRAVH
ncbi:histidine phosphatase family protein [Ferrovibrio sp.]|uniref:histidine phosphatase family protein n=1 Tax=Ferrovibrio sp. TaxID=1917215 RepID=UPI00311F7B7C